MNVTDALCERTMQPTCLSYFHAIVIEFGQPISLGELASPTNRLYAAQYAIAWLNTFSQYYIYIILYKYIIFYILTLKIANIDFKSQISDNIIEFINIFANIKNTHKYDNFNTTLDN